MTDQGFCDARYANIDCTICGVKLLCKPRYIGQRYAKHEHRKMLIPI